MKTFVRMCRILKFSSYVQYLEYKKYKNFHFAFLMFKLNTMLCSSDFFFSIYNDRVTHQNLKISYIQRVHMGNK